MDKNFLSLWYVQVLVVLVLVGIVASLTAYTKVTLREAKYGQYGLATITVSGEGEVMTVPDIGNFSFSVRAEGEDAVTAQDKSAESINAISSYLKEAGIEDRDIKTTNYNLNPTYTYKERICPAGSYCPPTDPVIDGYEVSQTITVKVRDLDQSGNLITGVGERGATNISGLSFTIDDDSVLQDQAREKAIADAKERANNLAADLGVSIVRITGYYEEQNYPYESYGYGGDMAMNEKSEASARPNLPTGENTTASVVNVTFEVR